MITIKKEKQESYKKANIFYIYKKTFVRKYTNDKYYRNVWDHCHYIGKCKSASYSICNLKNSIPQEIGLIFHNGSNYYNHFIIKELAKDFKGEFNFLGENAKKKTKSFLFQ